MKRWWSRSLTDTVLGTLMWLGIQIQEDIRSKQCPLPKSSTLLHKPLALQKYLDTQTQLDSLNTHRSQFHCCSYQWDRVWGLLRTHMGRRSQVDRAGNQHSQLVQNIPFYRPQVLRTCLHIRILLGRGGSGHPGCSSPQGMGLGGRWGWCSCGPKDRWYTLLNCQLKMFLMHKPIM